MKVWRSVLKLPRGYRSPEAGSFVAQLDELTGSMNHDLRGTKVAELEWQPRAGMNTIGMLLAHIAIVEVWWIENAVRGIPAAEVEFERFLGIGLQDDGMPAPPRGGHPAALRGWRLATYQKKIRAGRANLRRVAKTLTRDGFERPRRRLRRDGVRHVYNARWVFYHLLEHLAGHYGQILMLRHAYRDRRKPR